MTAKYTVIDSQVLSTSAASVTFSSIPGGYKDLVLSYQVKLVSGSGYFGFRLNGDSGTNYNTVSMHGNGSTAASYSSPSQNFGLTGLAVQSSSYTIGSLQIADFSATNKHSTCLSRENDSAIATSAAAIRWANTAAVTSLYLAPTSGALSWAAGSTFRLLGVN
jgi:hypothetical protein